MPVIAERRDVERCVRGPSGQGWRWALQPGPRAATGLLLASLLVPAPEGHAQHFQSVPCTVSRALSASGEHAVGSHLCGGGLFVWSAEHGLALLGLPPGATRASAEGVSADGSIVVGTASYDTFPERSEAFRWTAATGFVGLGVLPGAADSRARGISDDGAIVVGDSGGNAVRWTANGIESLGLGSASAVSADGTVVVGWNGSEEAMRWTAAGGMVGLGHLPGALTGAATDVSADGSVVVGRESYHFNDPSGKRQEAFRWTSGTGMVGLGHLGDWFQHYSEATGVSADGSVVVGNNWGGSGLNDQAILWDAVNGMRYVRPVLQIRYDLFTTLRNWQFEEAVDVSDDGSTIAGNGHLVGSGASQLWIAMLDCEPWSPDIDGDGTPDGCDNCRDVANPDQSDVGGLGNRSAPDGIGDACQCGDVTADGVVTIADTVAIRRSLLDPPTAVLQQPALCDVTGDGRCSLEDAVVALRAQLVPPTATITDECSPAP